MNNAIQLDARRGTAVWGANRFRSDALASLLDDLTVRESKGLNEKECGAVKIALGFLVNSATTIPDKAWWRTTIWEELQDFLDIYETWNNEHGDSKDSITRRQCALKKLRAKRNRIATKVRHHQLIIQSELDLKLIKDMYGALGKLANTFPDIFIQLGEAVSRFYYVLDKANNDSDQKNI